MPERSLGQIVLLQVQRDPVKIKGVGYDPTPLLHVPEIAIGPDGVLGRHEGAWIVDVHHRDHPRSHGRGKRALSIGFTGHYELMAGRFGSAPVGCAGENVVVAAEGRLTERDLAGTVVVSTSDGDVELRDARVAAPCAEFTSFMKGLDAVMPAMGQRDDVDFLDEGTRGFILDTKHLTSPVMIRVGDEVFVRS